MEKYTGDKLPSGLTRRSSIDIKESEILA